MGVTGLWSVLEPTGKKVRLQSLQGKVLAVGKEFLRALLNKSLRIELTDGRTLEGLFYCVDRDANIIIGGAAEYANRELKGEARVLGLAMVPGRHVVSIVVKKEELTYEQEKTDANVSMR